jgi:hypothetical protein
VRVIEPSGLFIERAELDEHFDEGRFPGLRRQVSSDMWGALSEVWAFLS